MMEPPVGLAYQKMLPVAEDAERTTLPVLILEFGVVPVNVGLGLTTIVIVFDVAGEALTQAAFEVIIQVMISPLTSVVEVNVVLLAPTFIPFLFH